MTWLRRLPVLGEIAARLGATSAKSAARLEAGELEALGESYIAATRRHRRTKHPFFTDDAGELAAYRPHQAGATKGEDTLDRSAEARTRRKGKMEEITAAC